MPHTICTLPPRCCGQSGVCILSQPFFVVTRSLLLIGSDITTYDRAPQRGPMIRFQKPPEPLFCWRLAAASCSRRRSLADEGGSAKYFRR